MSLDYSYPITCINGNENLCRPKSSLPLGIEARNYLGFTSVTDYATEMQNKITSRFLCWDRRARKQAFWHGASGEHLNIIPLPESDWIGNLAIDLAVRYQIGTARGERSVLSAMDIQREEFFANFGQSINY
jgi:hypothetical protein